jgi:hypothetical protein
MHDPVREPLLDLHGALALFALGLLDDLRDSAVLFCVPVFAIALVDPEHLPEEFTLGAALFPRDTLNLFEDSGWH